MSRFRKYITDGFYLYTFFRDTLGLNGEVAHAVSGGWERGLKKTATYLRNPKHLLQRACDAFGVPYQYIELETVILYVNTICNARCPMCDVGQKNMKGIDRLRESGETFLNIGLLRKLLADDYVKKRRLDFNLLMTEPLLHPEIEHIIAVIKEGGHRVKMTTNGMLLGEKAEALVSSGLDSIQVSLDGPPDLHNRIRGANIYAEAIRGIQQINGSSGMRVIVDFTVSCLNDSSILEFLSTINREVKIDLVKIQLMDFVSESMSREQNENYPIEQTESSISEIVNPEKIDFRTLSEQLTSINPREYKNIRNIRIIPFLISEGDLREYYSLSGRKIKEYSRCSFPWHNIAFRTDGKIFIHFRCFNYEIGDFERNSIEEVMFGERVQYFRDLIRKAGYCFPACTRCCGTKSYGLASN